MIIKRWKDFRTTKKGTQGKKKTSEEKSFVAEKKKKDQKEATWIRSEKQMKTN